MFFSKIRYNTIKTKNIDVKEGVIHMYDVAVIGGGPAGMNAALYAARKELSVVLVTSDFGGQMLLTNEIENYLGFTSISGFELTDKMEAHMREYPVEVNMAQVEQLEKREDGTFALHLDDGKTVEAKTTIVTAGKRSRMLGIPGEKEYAGRGVSYCATCDAPFYRGKTTAVVGGGDSAVQAAIELSVLCPKVYLLVRSRLRAQEILVKRMKEHDNIEVFLGYTPQKVEGEKKVSQVTIRETASGKETVLPIEGFFVEAGGIPNNSFLPKDLALNAGGEIITDKEGRTNIPGLFGAGDVTNSANKQIIISAGEGAAAALAAHSYLLTSEA